MQRQFGKNKRLTLLSCVLIPVFLLAACDEPERTSPIELPATPALAMQSSWAVITSSHLRLREAPNTESNAVATLWQGSVLEIVSKTSTKEIVEDEESFWYQINFDGLAGWVFGAYLEMYDTKQRAEESARELRR